ncbi:conserved hypothetical protein [Sporisorium reilianum SRZ2]|uniref:Vps72/YL1 C-terminal domain-containing protein n=1 Tax=Sporisorium reilianum (strain SRZ2) TaxID=999809 RepID=E6ZW07_SPORE|nr:conserved hypothetical protein [Sporisorium reilianum SRZ2]
MSTARSSPSAGPSRSASPEPPAPSYRIERFDASRSTDLMVTSRARRSTAGNRLKALLDQELEKDEVFAEVENDVDFIANENDDGVDIVDSDFDRDSGDEARGGDDESAGEREIEAQEKADRLKRRAAVRGAAGVVKRPPAVRRAAPETAPPEAKRRRISFAPDQPSSSLAGSSRRRTSARAATVQSKREVESRLEEASQRRAAQPAKHVVKKKATLTQDALIAEALEVEEENRESLRRFLEQEEERRAKQRQRKERITGPFVRWVSVGLRTKVVEEVKDSGAVEKSTVGTDGKAQDKGKARENEAQAVGGVDRTGIESKQMVASTGGGSEQQRSESVPRSVLDGQQTGDGNVNKANAPASSAQPEASADSQSKDTRALDKDASGDVTMADRSAAIAQGATPTLQSPSKDSDRPLVTTTLPATLDARPTPPAPSTAALTLDPVIAARQQTALLRAPTTPTPTTSTRAAASSTYELQARTLLSVERAPSDWEWLDEHTALLGTHCTWDRFPFVPARNRPLKPRQSICAITGLPAIYKDPRTGIAYANAHAYSVIGRLLHGRYVWSGGHYEDRGRKVGGKGERGKVGVGAVPPEMGVYLDDEQEAGPGGVWGLARDAVPTAKGKEAHPPPAPKDSPSTPAARQKAPTPAPAATPQPSQTAAEKKKSKPGFDVVLTNAIAPGDEKAVLAAALSLPAGSTRSGRRVQRP